jgi:hypothetical protein
MPDEGQELDTAISDALLPEKGVLTHYVIVAEYYDEAGERMLVTDSSDATAAWQRDGLLYHALNEWDWDDDEED